MITTYRIELWNPTLNRYESYWSHHSLEIAERQMKKSYNARHTRRLIKTTEEVLYKEKGRKLEFIKRKT